MLRREAAVPGKQGNQVLQISEPGLAQVERGHGEPGIEPWDGGPRGSPACLRGWAAGIAPGTLRDCRRQDPQGTARPPDDEDRSRDPGGGLGPGAAPSRGSWQPDCWPKSPSP